MISVIVPVYNKENGIYQCIESILNQSFTDLECIVVDNNSTDSSMEIVNSFKDDRIRICDCKEQGVHHARNKGIQEAKGEWISFIDADDFIDHDYLETLVKAINDHPGYKCYTCSAKTIQLNGRVSYWHNIPEGEYTIDDCILYRYGTSWDTVWNCLWSRDVFEHLYFKIKQFEDQLINKEFLMLYKKLYHIDNKRYHHIINNASISVVYNDTVFIDYVHMTVFLLK